MDEPKVARKVSKIEVIFELLAVIENKTHNLKSNSKDIKEKLLGSFPETDAKSEVADTVAPSGILQNIIDQLADIRDYVEHATDYLDRVAKEIEKK